MFIGFF
ncbi:hypothetical protein VCHC62A1_3222A, partial [Vibrio cholerae HC-62A1]